MSSALIRSRAQEMLARIKRFSSPATKKQMREKFGIQTEKALGTPVTTLRLLVKGLPRPDQELADALWDTGVHEARIMASMLADPAQMTYPKLDEWAKELNSWDICDLCAGNLFSKVKNPLKLAERWIKREEEFVRRAGFAVIAALACAAEILDLYEDNKAARWVASNAVWELKSPQIKAMVAKRK